MGGGITFWLKVQFILGALNSLKPAVFFLRRWATNNIRFWGGQVIPVKLNCYLYCIVLFCFFKEEEENVEARSSEEEGFEFEK